MASYEILTLLTVFASLILVFQAHFTESEVSQKEEDTYVNEYPGLFRREVEIAELNRGISTNRRTEACCCSINSSLIAPTTVLTVGKKIAKVIQFPIWKQYIEVDTCRQSDGCDECMCIIANRYFSLLVLIDGKGSFELCEYPAVCRCFNGEIP